MIWLTRTDHQRIVLNCDLIEHIESTPDTVITMTTGQKVRVSESADEIIERTVAFQRRLRESPRVLRAQDVTEDAGE